MQDGQELVIRAWGGDRMAEAGAEVVKHYRDLAFMGFTQVILNLRTILRNMSWCKADLEAFKPDAVILIDYPGFNLRIAGHVRKLGGIKVIYYISPQVWAWKKGRVHAIIRDVDRMFVILPFEQQWYANHGMDVDFVGHPLLDAIQQEGTRPLEPLPGDDGRPLVAMLPGSRQQEVAGMLPIMLKAAERFPDHRFVIAAAPSLPEAFYRDLIGSSPVTLVFNRTYDVLRTAKAALVTSGTATLETALFGVPEAVCYNGGAINVWLARRLIKIEFISLVNLIMEREVVRELIQQGLTPKSLGNELDRLLNDAPYRLRVEQDLAALREKLGGPGASAKAASGMWKILTGRT
jgi:lipid-A-disaccharide synthase